MIDLTSYLTLAAILFAISVAGIFLNRKNVVVLLMCIELMLLGQVFVFFILTVAAAEAAIGLAILVVLFRSRHTIDVEDLDDLKG